MLILRFALTNCVPSRTEKGSIYSATIRLFRDNPLDSGIHELTSRGSQVRNLHRPPIALVSAIAPC